MVEVKPIHSVSLTARFVGRINKLPNRPDEAALEAVDVMTNLTRVGVRGINDITSGVEPGVLMTLIWVYGDDRQLAVVMEMTADDGWRIEAMGVGVAWRDMECEFVSTVSECVSVTYIRDTMIDYGPDVVMRIFANTFGNFIRETTPAATNGEPYAGS